MASDERWLRMDARNTASDPAKIIVEIDIEHARTLVAHGDCMCDLTPGTEQGTCIVCVVTDELFKQTGEGCYDRKAGADNVNQ
jgi:hypothetical protein